MYTASTASSARSASYEPCARGIPCSRAYASARARSRLPTATTSTRSESLAPSSTRRLMFAVERIPQRVSAASPRFLTLVTMDVQELRPGLWRWTARHPEWDDREVSSAYLETADRVCLIDPLVPREEEERFFVALDGDVERIDLPVAIVLTNPWHRRSADELAQR